MSHRLDASSAVRMRGLRTNSFAAVTILLIEYGLGVWVNLYGHLPASDHGADIPTGFARAVANGPVGLAIHALVGVVLIASATSAVIRSILLQRASLITVTTIALVSIAVAAVSGTAFVGRGDNASSMAMAISAAVAIGAYTLVLFISADVQATLRS